MPTTSGLTPNKLLVNLQQLPNGRHIIDEKCIYDENQYVDVEPLHKLVAEQDIHYLAANYNYQLAKALSELSFNSSSSGTYLMEIFTPLLEVGQFLVEMCSCNHRE